ncbi:MAG: ABC transporter substrate-binding protein, partial [Planctomycetota bacterium]
RSRCAGCRGTRPRRCGGRSDLVFQDASNAYRRKEYAEALSLLDEAYKNDPSRAATIAATEKVATNMFDNYLATEQFVAARAMVTWAEKRFGRRKMASTISGWEKKLASRAQSLFDRARKDRQAGKLADAYDLSNRAIKIWPDTKGLLAFSRNLAAKYPVARVGVTRPARDMDPRRAEDWASRRTGRLRYRTLVEIKDYGPDGGEYDCPLGVVEVTPDGREINIRLKRGNDAIANLFSGYDLANVLLDMARPGGDAEVPLWSQLAGSIKVQDVFDVNVKLTQPVLRPEALLQTPLVPLGADAELGPTNPYSVKLMSDTELRLALNQLYAARRSTQPSEIIEKYYGDPAEMVRGLLSNDIDVADRLFPGDVERLRRDERVVVRPYAVPSIHFLIPNFKKPLMQRRTYRRGLVYGISRKTILEQDLLGNSRVRGCQLISGPFPPGVDSDDPLGYAYNPRIKPRGYEPALAVTLTKVGWGELEGLAEKKGEPAPVKKPLVLAHPAAAVPRIGASAIAQYLTAIGIECETLELRAGQTKPLDDNEWDLLYVDMVSTEPMFDIRRVLGASGLIEGGSSYLELALRRLGLAVNWEQSRETLQEIHRLAHEEVAVIPLWQLTEFFAFNPRVQNMSEFPLSLYQDIESWRIAPEKGLAGR